MKNALMKFIVLLAVIASGYTTFASVYPPLSAEQHDPANDSVTVTGKFISPCHIPEKVKIWKYNLWDVYVTGITLPVSANGEFSYRLPVNGPQQVSIKVNETQFDFVATPAEKTYHVEITCGSAGQTKIEVKNSDENKAFAQLIDLCKTFNDSLSEAAKYSQAHQGSFDPIRKRFLDYQKHVSVIAKEHPQTFTAQVLCSSEILPEQTFSSMQAFKENYLQRNVLANQSYYGINFLTLRVLANYLLLFDKNDTTFVGFSKALDKACTNPEAGRLLEQIFYGTLYYQHKELLLRSYIYWSKAHTNMMYNQIVQAQLRNLDRCIAGSPFIEISLPDTKGVTRKLSETVNSAKLTLLIFYSPTCSHCQETLPKIVPLWDQFKSKGFKIYALGFEGSDNEWFDFIKNKGTGEWTNVFRHTNGPGVGYEYMSTNTPTFILIDKDGKIVTRFADLEYLRKELPVYFAN